MSKYDEGVLAFSDEDKKIAWKNYHEKLLNTDFAWHRNSLSQEDTISSIYTSLNKDIVTESIIDIKMKRLQDCQVWSKIWQRQQEK